MDVHNTSAEVEAILKGTSNDSNDLDERSFNRLHMQTTAYLEMSRKNGNRASSMKSFGDRSLDELSIHDQLVLVSEDQPEDPKLVEYRNYLLNEVKALNGKISIQQKINSHTLAKI